MSASAPPLPMPRPVRLLDRPCQSCGRRAPALLATLPSGRPRRAGARVGGEFPLERPSCAPIQWAALKGGQALDMRVCVPIKQVPETGAVKMDEVTGTMVREGVEAIVNPLDLYAIELALRLREGPGSSSAPGPGGEVVTISMGPPKADRAIREALAMGCDRGVLISDPAFAGSDTWATSYVLASAIRKLGPFDLIVCGERATDGDTGQVGPGIAAFCDLPVVTYVSKVRSIGDGLAVVERLVENGHEVLEMRLPGVVTVVKEVGDPRLPTLRGKQRARLAEVPRWGPDEVGADRARVGLTGSPTRVVRIFRPTVARTCEKLLAADESATARAVERVVEFLREKRIL